MTSSSSSGGANGRQPGAPSDVTLPAKLDPANAKPTTSARAPASSAPGSDARPATARSAAPTLKSADAANAWDPIAAPAPQATIPCPKCGAPVREIARFCQRCHMTMRFECPSCGNKQRTGVKCEKCEIDFLKYIGAVVAAKAMEVDSIEEKIDQREAFLKNIITVPFTGGLSLIKRLVRSSK